MSARRRALSPWARCRYDYSRTIHAPESTSVSGALQGMQVVLLVDETTGCCLAGADECHYSIRVGSSCYYRPEALIGDCASGPVSTTIEVPVLVRSRNPKYIVTTLGFALS